ncbi:MAG: nucleotide sugar dehydrogenase, partial [Thermoproteota archaeon]
MKPFLTTPDEAVKRLREGTYTVGIFGFGRVGLVIGVGWELAGARIIGMTLDKQALKLLKSGISPFPEEEYLSEYIDGLIRKGLMEVTDDLAYGARSSDIKIIAVPAYLTKEGKPDLSPVKKVAHEISLSLSRGDVVIVETSLPPGTTRDLIKPILEENSGLRADEDFALAYSPERISAGTALKDFLENYPKIIGCDSQR